MPVTRRSTRSSTKAGSESVSKKSEDVKNDAVTRTKRGRDDKKRQPSDAEDLETPPPKKVVKTKPSKHAEERPEPPPSTKSTKTTAPVPIALSESNRDANGEQEVYWLLKAEPLPRFENGVNVAFSIDDLRNCTEPEPWGGVRNAQARNNMQAMKKGDLGFFYHSNAKPSGVAGILRVVEEAKVDETAFDPKDPYYDPKSDRNKPKWYCVGVEFVKKFDQVLSLHELKSYGGAGGPLEHMQLISAARLSVGRVRKAEWDFINSVAEKSGAE